MICAACASPTMADPCEVCGVSPLLGDRYRLDVLLGTGAGGSTWRGTRLSDGATVAVKERLLRDLQATELADRESRVLAELSHAAIPKVLETLATGHGKTRGSWLIQTFVEGKTLAAEAATRRYTERDVLEVMDELFGILAYLHGLSPPVLHRDIKPANVIRGVNGRLFLVDFGSVRDRPADADLGGKTVTGTFGFMAPECFAGEASVRSDIYGVAALAIALLSRKDPATMHSLDGRFDWRGHLDVDPAVATYLGRLTERDPQRRPASVADARAELWALLAPATSSPTITPLIAGPVAVVQAPRRAWNNSVVNYIPAIRTAKFRPLLTRLRTKIANIRWDGRAGLMLFLAVAIPVGAVLEAFPQVREFMDAILRLLPFS